MSDHNLAISKFIRYNFLSWWQQLHCGRELAARLENLVAVVVNNLESTSQLTADHRRDISFIELANTRTIVVYNGFLKELSYVMILY